MIIAPIIFCTVVVDAARMTKHLDGETDAEADEPEEVLDATEAPMPTSITSGQQARPGAG